MAWSDLEEVEHLPRRGLLRDGRLVLFPRELDGELALLGPAGQRHARITDRLHGAPFALPLGLTTRVLGAHGDLTGALAALAGGRCEVVEVVRAAPDDRDRRRGRRRDRRRDRLRADADTDADIEAQGDPDDGAEPRSPPARPPARCARSLPRSEPTSPATATWEPADTEPDGIAAVSAAPLPAIPSATTTFVIDDLADVPVVDPVIGPELAGGPRAARGSRSTSSPSAPGSARTSSRPSRSTTSRRAAATSTPAATCARWPGCSASTSRRCSRPTTRSTPTRRSTRAGSSRPSSPPAGTAPSAAPGAARTGR